MANARHFTTRRGFIAAGGFGGISLYGLWAAYGAAPGPMGLLGLDHSLASTEAAPASGAHAGHGAAETGPSTQEFSRWTEQFVERYRLPDGSVYPRRMAHPAIATTDPHAGHDMAGPADSHAGHEEPTALASPTVDAHGDHAGEAMSADTHAPIDVLITAGRWYYLPDKLRLDAGQAYRFKMMAVDMAHGASIQLGQAGRMMRLQPGRITEAALTFHQPGRYLMLCTVYCGEAHQLMQATIEVV